MIFKCVVSAGCIDSRNSAVRRLTIFTGGKKKRKRFLPSFFEITFMKGKNV